MTRDSHPERPRAAPPRGPLVGPFGALLALLAWLWSGDAAAEALALPAQLVVQFDESAGSLDQERIRQALQQELGIPIVPSGSAGAPTLTLRLDEGGDLELVYDPERHRASRSVALTEATNVPELVAQLAGNMVRDEASLLIADLSPRSEQAAPASPPPAPASPAAEPSKQPVQAAEPTGHNHAEHPWAFTVLLGGGIRPMAFGVLTLQGSRRFGRLELGVAVEGALGRGSVAYGDAGENAGFYGYSGSPLRESSSVMTLTLPASLDVDLLRREQAYLQLGVAAGYRIAGVLSRRPTHVSGSDAAPFFGVRFTAGLALRERRMLLLRGAWDVVPRAQVVPAGDDTLNALSFGTFLQLGYAMSF